MSHPVWLMIMDVLVMIMLAAMLFFAMRLSVQLKDFRAGRKDLDKLVADLNASVNKAERAIQGLKENARVSGRELQAKIDDAKTLSDELQMVAEAGSNMASRLERSAKPAAARTSGRADTNRVEKSGGFAIRDTEFEQGGAADETAGGDDGDEQLHSRAERELFEALRTGRRPRGGAGA
jgi:hypothetical protein